MTDSATYLSQLHQLLNQHFDLAEIRTLCLDLNVDYESIAGEEKPSRIRELLLGLGRNGRLPELVTLAQQLRPNVDWPLVPDDFELPEQLAGGETAVPTNQYHVYGDAVQGDKVEGDKVAGHKITVQFVEGIKRLSPTYANRIQNFLDTYLGTPENPIPFGGRNAELEVLNEWLLDENTPPYALIAAEAGRGKSALLAQWSRGVIENERAHVVFVPISIRFDTASDIVTYQALTARIGEIYGERVKYADRPASEWQEVYLSYLRRTPPDNKPILVIIDGIDEGGGTQAGPNLLPQVPAKGVRAVVSARYLSGDVDDSGWLRRLGWEQSGKARGIPLPPLTKPGIGDVLAKMGDPLDALATEIDVLNELFRLSEGDPLLVRLYVEALLPYGEEQIVALRPEDLPNIDKGLSGYFRQWWTDQEKQWAAQGRDPLHEKQEVETFLHVCAAALGPLSQEDVAWLVPDLASGIRLQRTAREVGRFVIGDGKQRGFVFSHSRLAQYFWEEMGLSKQEEWEGRFLAYGREVLDALHQDTMMPDEVSLYLTQNYGAHLTRSAASLEEILHLTTKQWCEASVTQTKTYAAFLNDVSRAWQRASDCHAMTPESFEGQTIGHQMRCALITTSIRNLTLNIPPELVAQLAETEMWSPAQALATIQHAHDVEDRAKRVATIFPYLPKDLQPRVIEDALTNVIPNVNKRKLLASKSLEYLIPCIPLSSTDRILSVVNQYHWLDRFIIVRELALRWANAGYHDQAIFIAGLQLRVSSKLEALVALLPHLPDPEREEAINSSLFLIRFVPAKGTKLHMLVELLPYLPDAKRPTVLEECLKVGKVTEYPTSLISLLPFANESQRAEIVNGVLTTVKKQKQPQDQAKALKQIIPFLEFSPQDTPLELVNLFESPQWQAEILGTLAGQLSTLGYFNEALDLLENILDQKFQPLAMLNLTTALPPEERESLLTGVVNALPQLTKEITLFKKIVEQAAPYLSPEQMNATVQVVLALEYGRTRAEVLTKLANYCLDEQRTQVLEEALESSQTIEDELWQVEPLVESGSRLNNEDAKQNVFMQAYLAATKVSRPDMRVRALTAIAPHLKEPLRTQTFQEALSIVRNNLTAGEISTRFKGLIEVLPVNMLPEALQIAQLYRNNLQMHVLARVASRLPEPDNIRVWQHIFRFINNFDSFLQAQLLQGEAHVMPSAVLDQATDLARKLPLTPPDSMGGCLRIRTLIVLAFRFSEPKRTELIEEALSLAKAELGDEYWAQMVAELCDHVPQMKDEQFQERVVGILDDLKPLHARALALAFVARCFPESQRSELFLQVLHLLDSVENHRRADILRVLISSCPIGLLPNMLKIARSLSNLRDQVELMLFAAFRLDTQERSELITEIFSLMPQKDRSFWGREWVWVNLVELMKQMDPMGIYSLWKSCFPNLAQRERHYLLYDIRELLPVIQILGGEEAVQETADAIIEICEWWP